MAFIDENGNWIAANPPVRPGAVTVNPGGPISRPAAPVPGVGAIPGSIPIGGYQPDYKALIAADPGYVAWKASSTSRLGTLASQRVAAIRALAVRQGGLPPGFKDAYGDIRPEDLAAAQSNQFSATNQIARNYQLGVNAMRSALAARGGLQSGELGYGQQQQDYSRAAAEYNSNNDFTNAFNQAVNDYSSGASGIYGEEPGVIGQAESNVYQNYQPVDSHPATLIPDSVTTYGFAVYKDPDGTLWRIDPVSGNPVQFTTGGSFAPGATGAITNPQPGTFYLF
jgi:hypothetical protein